MEFYGLQKLTLLDFPQKTACTVFCGGCNFRCPFCHNALLVTEPKSVPTYSEADIVSFLKGRIGLLDGVCITGGEPLLYKDVVNFIAQVKQMGFLVKLDTNGSFPDRLAELLDAGLLDYVAMDIKNCKEKYPATVGVPEFDIRPIEKSISVLMHGNTDFEFRTTVVKEFHTTEDIKKIEELISGAPRYFLQHFVDSGNLIGQNLHPVSPSEMAYMRDVAASFVKNAQIRGL